jgi:hypothetical protein
MAENDSGKRHADGNKTIIDSSNHIADAGKMVSPNAALRAVAAQFMQTMASRFAETCHKFGISEKTAGALLAGMLLLDEPENAEAFEVEWSDVYDMTLAATEAEHDVTIETDNYHVEVVGNDTGDSVLCEWGDSLANDRSDQ